MPLSRRAFLRVAAMLAAAAGAPGVSRVIRRFRAPDSTGEVPALAAEPGTPGRLVRLDGLPTAGGAAVAYAASPQAPQARLDGGRRWIMVIDLSKCDGCRECTRACTAMHFVPAGQEWIKVYEIQDNPLAAPYWFPRPCMQCDNPPCVKVCPVSATWKREDGIVVQDTSRCIGCRFCIAACPYQARYFNWVEPPHTPEEHAQPYSTDWNFPHVKGVTEKCIFCPGLIKQGKLPACVDACPMGAIYFGDEREDAVTNSQGETLPLGEIIQRHAGYRFMEELGTEPRVYYLPPRVRRYPAPARATGEPAAAGGHR